MQKKPIVFNSSTIDLWHFSLDNGQFSYRLYFPGNPIPDIISYLPILDWDHHIHLLLKTKNGQIIYTYWDGNKWHKKNMNLSAHPIFFSYVSNQNSLYLLAKDHALTFYTIEPTGKLSAKSLTFDSYYMKDILYFYCQDQFLYLYYLDNQQILNEMIITINNGSIFKRKAFMRLQQPINTLFVSRLNHLLFCCYEAKTYEHHTIYCLIINLLNHTIEQKEILVHSSPVDNLCFMADQYTLMLLLSYDHYLYSCFSFDHGLNWTTAKKNTLFAPHQLLPILGVNQSMTNKVAFQKIKGIDLTHCLYLSFIEMVELLK